MIDYVSVKFEIADPIQREVLNYRLSEAQVESIEELDDHLLAYFTKETWQSVSKLSVFQALDPQVSDVKHENWNAKWEAGFKPVSIDDFCYVRAPFHSKGREELIDIILEPKMAFGTAHHETTYMMMSEMKGFIEKGQNVLDYGCGTAILSILAEKLHARSIYAIDIEENAIENSNYNAAINGCTKITCELKVLAEIAPRKFDRILANINRNVLLESAEALIEHTEKGGQLLLSGILINDEKLVSDKFESVGFTLLSSRSKGEWKCLKFSRPNS
ncbi:50S ribosomal protein L11 methyltransferase [Portibacter marinus]|uniref:50S ribosomal protein L11 methyltransferase n=1 Tax=Portibacter marinus TaxID=2898660 RepID=UPI001F492042|nr:50S ribosomal protein L11 methyltransferase [Portibacter marinus]